MSFEEVNKSTEINNFIKFLQSNETYSNKFIKNMLQTNYSNEDYWSEILSLMLFSDKKVEDFVLNNLYLFNNATNYLKDIATALMHFEKNGVVCCIRVLHYSSANVRRRPGMQHLHCDSMIVVL